MSAERVDQKENGDRGSPLSGVRVLDFTQNVAGPFATMVLADLGADVIKVEAPGLGDATRGWGPPFPFGEGASFVALNRNKRSIELDLGTSHDRMVARRLIQRSDVVVESMRPGVMEEFTLGPNAAFELNPRLIYCSISAFGTTTSRASQPGYDPLIQASAGMMQVTGSRDGEPVRVGVSIIDQTTGLWSALGILASLRSVDAGQGGTWLKATLFETGLAWMGYHAVGYWANGEEPERWGTGMATIVPYQGFHTSDGLVMIAAGNDSLFERLASALDVKELATDSRFRSNGDRVQNRQLLIPLLEECTKRFTNSELITKLQQLRVPCAEIRSLGSVLNDPEVQHSGIIQEFDFDGSNARTIGTPLVFGQKRCEVRLPPPRFGEHTQEILHELEV